MEDAKVLSKLFDKIIHIYIYVSSFFFFENANHCLYVSTYR